MSINRRMDPETVVYTMEYHSAIKNNVSKSALTRWMNLEPVRVKEVRKRKTSIIY